MEPLPIDAEQKAHATAKRGWVLRGVLGWGGLMSVVMMGLDYRQDPALFPFNRVGLARIALGALIFMTCGYFWGLAMWRRSMKSEAGTPKKS